MTYSKAIIKRIDELSTQKKLTINGLANRAGLQQSTVDAIIKGTNKRPRIDTLHKIATAFNMTVSEFLDFPEMNNTIFDEDE